MVEEEEQDEEEQDEKSEGKEDTRKDGNKVLIGSQVSAAVVQCITSTRKYPQIGEAEGGVGWR